jgi:ABC-type arginine transport system ATPase subunit
LCCADVRLAVLLGLVAGRSALLRLLRALPDPEVGTMADVNTKIKMLKRQTYGKASFALLRKRILLT